MGLPKKLSSSSSENNELAGFAAPFVATDFVDVTAAGVAAGVADARGAAATAAAGWTGCCCCCFGFVEVEVAVLEDWLLFGFDGVEVFGASDGFVC